MTLIRLEDVTLTYGDSLSGELAPAPTLRDVTLEVDEGELVLVVGPTGSGKSTLLGLLGGHVPHFTGGHVAGLVEVDGRNLRDHRPRDLADVVGVVGQNPLAGFVTDTVEEELAYAMEQIGLPPAVMRKRVEETLDLLGIAELRYASLRDLSGGQQQRVAIGSVLTAHPRILVLDEPTSALDPTGAEDVLAALSRLVHDLGVTVVVAEHRIERVIHLADSIIEVSASGEVRHGPPAEIMADARVAPPIVELSRLLGWSPVPLSIRDARRRAKGLDLAVLRALSGDSFRPIGTFRSAQPAQPAQSDRPDQSGDTIRPIGTFRSDQPAQPAQPAQPGDSFRPIGTFLSDEPDHPDHPRDSFRPIGTFLSDQPALVAERLVVRYGEVAAVADVTVGFDAGTVSVMMGRNGAGKSSLLWAMQGSGPKASGSVRTADGNDPAELAPPERRRAVTLVPQSASDLLYLETVAAECVQADAESGAAAGTCAALLEAMVTGIDPQTHPRDLSEGQRLALVLAVQLTGDPAVVMLDEPTRGLDYAAKAALTARLRRMAASGQCVIVSTHDVEFAAGVADRVLVMAEGEIVADGAPREILVSSPAFAPQVSKILAPAPWLTVADVRAAVLR